jgi:hypothetical protein
MNFFKSLFFSPITLFRFIRFFILVYNSRNRIVILVDIDNTIADSWHSLLLKNQWRSECQRVADLAVFLGMRNLLIDLDELKEVKIIYYTARSISSVRSTLNWLKGVGIFFSNSSLVVTRTPRTKILYLQWLFHRYKRIIYIDDLSHKHETGNTIFFVNEIETLRKLENTRPNLKYLDVTTINKINLEYAKGAKKVADYLPLY